MSVDPPASIPGPSQLSSPSLPMTTDVEMQELQRRLVAVNPRFQVSEVLAQGHRKPYPGATVNTSATVPVYLILETVSRGNQVQDHK